MNRIAPMASLLLLLFLPFVGCAGSSSSPATPPVAQSTGVAVGPGSLINAQTRKVFLPLGMNSVGIVYPTQYAGTLCNQPDNEPGFRVGQALEAAQVAMTASPTPPAVANAQLLAMVNDWGANSVRFQVSQGALQYEYANHLSAYTSMVRSVIAQARAAGLVVIVVMQAESYSCTPLRSDGQLQKLPDQLTEQAWAQLLDSTLTNDPGVILEVFNEPNTGIECSTGTAVNWTDWATGCGTGPDEGMVTVGTYLRSLAPNNVLLFDGDQDADQFTGFTIPPGMPAQSAYTVHPYDYVVTSGGASSESASENNWNNRFGMLQTSGSAVLVSEWNESFQCPSDPNQTITDEFVQSYLPAHNMGLLPWAWDAPSFGSGYLVNPATFAPVNSNTACANTGAGVAQQEFIQHSSD